MKSSGWTWGTRKRDLDVARFWNLTPSQFYNLNRNDRLDCLALYEIDWRYQAINSYESNEEAKRKSKKKGGRK